MNYQRKPYTMDSFDILQKLGEGGFGSVYKIKRKDDGKIYAMKKVKMMKLSQKEKQAALNEIRILASLNSEFIVKYKEAFYHDPTSELCIVMEYADKGDLQGLVNKYKKNRTSIPESLIWDYVSQLLQGVKTMHDQNIIHRDLKGANIFLGDEGKKVLLGDLNVSKVQKTNFVHTQTGTPYYLAPEIWKGEPYNNKCDVWSLGCVVYELCALVPPFQATTMEGLYKKVLTGNYNKIPSLYSQELGKFIKMCLIINPRMRPSIKDLLQIPQVQSRISDVDITKQEKQQLLKTMKLPYGGLNNLKNVLPKAQYQDDKKEEEEQKKEELPKVELTPQQKLNSKANNNSIQRPGSSQPYKGVRSMSQDRLSSNQANVYQNYQKNFQQQTKQSQARQNSQMQQQQSSSRSGSRDQQRQSSRDNQRQSSRDSQRQSRGYGNQNSARPYSNRCASQERLMDNYKNANAYNPYPGMYGGRQNSNQYQQQYNQNIYNKPPQPGKPPMGGAKPPMNPSAQKPPQQPFFGKKKTNF